MRYKGSVFARKIKQNLFLPLKCAPLQNSLLWLWGWYSQVAYMTSML